MRNCGCGSFGTKGVGLKVLRDRIQLAYETTDSKMEQNQAKSEWNVSSRASIPEWERFIWLRSLPIAPAVPATPTLKELTNALKSVSNWKLLGVNLDLSGSELATIERDYHGDNTRCKTEMLSRWLENTTCPSWEAVVQALRLMEVNAVANTIQRKYVTTTATTEGKVLVH